MTKTPGERKMRKGWRKRERRWRAERWRGRRRNAEDEGTMDERKKVEGTKNMMGERGWRKGERRSWRKGEREGKENGERIGWRQRRRVENYDCARHNMGQTI